MNFVLDVNVEVSVGYTKSILLSNTCFLCPDQNTPKSMLAGSLPQTPLVEPTATSPRPPSWFQDGAVSRAREEGEGRTGRGRRRGNGRNGEEMGGKWENL